MKLKITLIILCTIIASCSLLENARKPLDQKPSGKTVPREQYDKLMKSYVELSKKHQLLTGKSSNESQETKIEKNSNDNDSRPEGLDANIDSVDVFAEVNKAQNSNTKNDTMPASPMNASAMTNKEVDLLKRALALKSSGKSDQALKIFQALETSTVIQVKVRAKYYLGEILLEKKQYDLAMQAFEGIVTNYAFSGLVVDSLRHLVTCTDQLGIVDKKQKYLLMLRDVFGSV